MKPARPRVRPCHLGAPTTALILSLLALSGCVSRPVTPPIHVEAESVDQEARLQRELRFKMAYEQQQRVARVTFPMLTAATELCGPTVQYVTGMSFSNRRSFEYGSEAIAILGLTDEIKVTSVIPGSPAALAGVRVDDLLVEVDGSALPKGAGATEALQSRLQELLKGGSSFKVTLARDGSLREATVIPARACAFSALAVDGDVVNAFADGSTVTVTVGMLRFVQDDTELALVVSHELAHNLMTHLSAKSKNAVVGVLMRVATITAGLAVARLGGAGYQARQSQSLAQNLQLTMPDRTSYTREFEAEADYVGLYMMARAGWQIDRAAQFWRRMGAAYPASNKSAFGASHPSDAYRMLALEETVQEIRRKIDEGSPLIPERGKSSFKKHDEVRAESAAVSAAPYRITFLLDSRTCILGEQRVVISDPYRCVDPLEYEDGVNRCLGEAMSRVSSSTSVINGRQFRRVAFPDFDPSEAPHTTDSLLALRKSVTFQRRIVPLGLQYIGVVKVVTAWKAGRDYRPSSSGESRFSVTVIDVGGQTLPYREEGTSWVSRGPGNSFRPLAFVDADSRACAELGERLAVGLTSRGGLPLSVRDDNGQ
jgi:Peptidase family M48/PDZ domain